MCLFPSIFMASIVSAHRMPVHSRMAHTNSIAAIVFGSISRIAFWSDFVVQICSMLRLHFRAALFVRVDGLYGILRFGESTNRPFTSAICMSSIRSSCSSLSRSCIFRSMSFHCCVVRFTLCGSTMYSSLSSCIMSLQSFAILSPITDFATSLRSRSALVRASIRNTVMSSCVCVMV